MSLFSKLAVGFPSRSKAFLKAEKAEVSLNELRDQIRDLRIEFWSRKIIGYPDVVRGARAEVGEIRERLAKPETWTVGNIGGMVVCGVQVYAMFCLGEAFGRKSLVGYNVGIDHYQFHPHDGI